jgi:hypothetical protein
MKAAALIHVGSGTTIEGDSDSAPAGALEAFEAFALIA